MFTERHDITGQIWEMLRLDLTWNLLIPRGIAIDEASPDIMMGIITQSY